MEFILDSTEENWKDIGKKKIKEKIKGRYLPVQGDSYEVYSSSVYFAHLNESKNKCLKINNSLPFIEVL